MKEIKKENNVGITLIALVITVIVLLILAGVSIAMLTGDNGILTQAQKAKNETEQAAIDEQNDINKLSNYINNTINNNQVDKVDRSNLKIGDYVDYTPSREEFTHVVISASETGYSQDTYIYYFTNPDWQILSINDDGTVDLTTNSTLLGESLLAINGAKGYNNFVYLLNKVCNDLYENKEFGIKARNMNMEDITKQLNEKGKDFMNSNTYPYVGYQQTVTVKNAYYPNLYAKENGSGINSTETKKDGIGPNEEYYSEPTTEEYSFAESLTVTQTVNFQNLMTADYFKNKDCFNLIFDGGYNMLATRGINCIQRENEYEIWFGPIFVNGQVISQEGAFYSSGYSNDGGIAGNIKPIVTINADISLENGDGSINNPYKLVKED